MCVCESVWCLAVCLVCEYVCINVLARRGNSSLRAVGSSCRRAVFVQPGFVGISYPAHVWESAGEGETAGVTVGASIRGLGIRGLGWDRERRTFSLTNVCSGVSIRVVFCVMLGAKGRSQTTRRSRKAWLSGLVSLVLMSSVSQVPENLL